MIDYFHKAGYVIDWIEFYLDAKKKGWNDKTIIDRIKYALIDVFDKVYANAVVERLMLYVASESLGKRE